MQYVIPAIKKIFDPDKIPPKNIWKTIFMRYRRQSVLKTLYQTDTIRPVVLYQDTMRFYSVKSAYHDASVIQGHNEALV